MRHRRGRQRWQGRRRRRVSPLTVSLGLGVVLAVVALLVASPRHREFYRRLLRDAPPGVSSPTAAPPAAPVARSLPTPPVLGTRPPATPPAAARSGPTGFATPIPPEAGAPPAAPSREARPEQEPRRKPLSPPVAPSQTVASVPRAGPGERVVVPIADELPPRLPMAGTPPGWELKAFVGRGHVEVVRDGARAVLRLTSEQTSFALYRDVALDVKDFPLLTWAWKVVKLPTGGDIRERASDDQAAQVYVIFPRWPHPRVNSDVVGYIWDSRAPVGLRVTSPQSPNVKLVVLQSGAERLGRWVREERNVYQDYLEMFGREPPRAGKIAIMIDSNDTGSQAEAFVDELVFLRAPPRTSVVPRPSGPGGRVSLKR